MKQHALPIMYLCVSANGEQLTAYITHMKGGMARHGVAHKFGGVPG